MATISFGEIKCSFVMSVAVKGDMNKQDPRVLGDVKIVGNSESVMILINDCQGYPFAFLIESIAFPIVWLVRKVRKQSNAS